MSHTFDPGKADRLDDVSRYRFLSRDELVALIDPSPGDTVADLGSGTGFYTDDVAPYAGRILALDLQPAMHEHYRANGVPGPVDLVTAAIGALPVADGALDAAFSTMTFHEFVSPGALAAVARALRPGGRFVAADWSAAGECAAGPPRSERHDADSARELIEGAGFEIEVARERPETFALAAHRQ